MPVVNQRALLTKAPIKNMLSSKERVHNVSHGLAEVGYDIRLKQGVHFIPNSLGFNRVCRIDENKVEHSEDGNFILASSMEEFDMPNDLVGIVHDKSTWARMGLSVFNTVIEPGWKGFLTLELVFHGAKPIYIPPGSGIAQVIFSELVMPVTYDGHYQNQEDRPIMSAVA